MATFDHSVSTSTVHRWKVPAAEPFGAPAEEIAKAWGAAESTYREVHGLAADKPLSGNALSFHVADDAVVIAFTVETPGGA
jgi:hypothetical protein